jgi:hypothetical protein
VLTVKPATGEPVAFQFEQGDQGKKKGLLRALEELVADDPVAVTWKVDGEKKVVTAIEASGTITGTVSAKAGWWIEVTPEGGKAQRFILPWRGGSPKSGVEPDKEIVKLIAAQKVGDKVALAWKLDDHKRIVSIKPAAEQAASEKPAS